MDRVYDLLFINIPQYGELEILNENGEPLFEGGRLASAMGYQNSSQALYKHCKTILHRRIPSLEKFERIPFIDKDNFYRLAARSRLPSAKLFKSRVYDKILALFLSHNEHKLNPPIKLKIFHKSAFKDLCFVVLNDNGIPYISFKYVFKYLRFNIEKAFSLCKNYKTVLIPTHRGLYPWDFISESDILTVLDNYGRKSYRKDQFLDFWNTEVAPLYPKDKITEPPDLVTVDTNVKVKRPITINKAKRYINMCNRKKLRGTPNTWKKFIPKTKITSIEQISSVKDLLSFLTYATQVQPLKQSSQILNSEIE